MSTLGAVTTWREVIEKATVGQHVALVYAEPGFLVRAVSGFIADGLRKGEGALVIATSFHWQAIASRLRERGFDVDVLTARGQLQALDAATCLRSFLVGGVPDRDRFWTTIGPVVASIRAAGYSPLRAFGEMVDVLRRDDPAGAIALEQLWNERIAAHGLTLLCGYSFDNFDRHVHHGLLQGVSAEHSHLIPVEDDARLDRAVERAYLDVFGADGSALRRTLMARYTAPAAMPDAESAILAARELLPTVADALLDRARSHYHALGGLPTH
jgi:DcmR-like sensory protein